MAVERTPSSELIRSTAIRSATVLAVGLLAWMLWHARLALFVTAVSALLAVALDRAVKAMERRGVPRTAGIALVLTIWAAILVALVIVFAIPAISQLQQLLAQAPELVARLRESEAWKLVERYVPLSTLQTAVPNRVGDVFSSAMGVATGVIAAAAGVVTVFFITAFMLGSGRPLIAAWIGAASPAQQSRYTWLVDRLYDSIGGYVTGLSIIIAIHAALATLFLGLLGVPWFLALGLMAGLSSLVPYIGVLVAGTVIVTIAAATSGLWTGVATLAWVVAYQQIENHIVSPLVYRRAIDVNPLLILIVALILAEVWGIGGAVLSVPITAAGQIVAIEVLRFRREGAPEVVSGAEVQSRGGG